MTTQQPVQRRALPNPSKMMRVAPNVTDPSMQSNKTQADVMLAEMGENPDSVDEVVFNRKKPTREEMDHQAAVGTSSSTDNTMLIIIFALIVIALVAIIVWMIMKQGSDKKEEEEVRRMIQPHPRNGMPPMNRYPVNQQQYNALQQQRRHQQMQQQQMRNQQQQQQQEEEEDPEVEDDTQQGPAATPAAKPKNTAKPAGPNAAGTVVGASAEDRSLSDKAEADIEALTSFTKEKPHPDIIKPGVVVAKSVQATSDVEDVMQRTEAMLNAKPTAEPTNAMNDADRALLDRIAKQSNDDDEEEEEDDE